MVYLVYLYDKELEIPVMTICKDVNKLTQLLANVDNDKYDIMDVNHTVAELIDNHSEFCKKPNDMEFGKGEKDVN